jgi:hypothetical protein
VLGSFPFYFMEQFKEAIGRLFAFLHCSA